MINQLVEAQNAVEVQQTSFSIDVLGRYICSTWDEAIFNGGRQFDAIVIGGGMFGAYCAEKIYRISNSKVLVLDAGAFLVSEHVQNLARIGLNTAKPVVIPTNAQDPGTRERVWGNPWRSNLGFSGLAYCLGGRSLYWGGWSPRLTNEDFQNWPQEIKDYLLDPAIDTYEKVEKEIGTNETTDYITGPLYKELKKKFKAVVNDGIPSVDKIEDAPLAVQGSAPASGLFSFDKYSSAPILIDAIREAADSPDNERRLFYVPRAHVVKLHHNGGKVTMIEARVNGQQKFLNVSANCSVVLATGTIECTRLAMESFPTPLMGKNLMGHLRSNITVRIQRDAISTTLPKRLEAAALLVRGSTPAGRYHIQVTASAIDDKNPEVSMFRMIPDLELLERHLASQDQDWIVITLRGIGEMVGDKNASSNNTATSWMDLSPFEKDQFGSARAWVNLVKTNADEQLWTTMDNAAIQIAQKLSDDDPSNIQYLYDKDGTGSKWHNDPPANLSIKVRDGLGTTHHEAGTLWMGTDSNSSITDLNGRFHHINNAYVAGPAIFPAIGSANPSLTALALARRTASVVGKELTPVVEEGFTPLLDSDFESWQMAGAGRFNRINNIIESTGGTGLLWYKKEAFKDFILKTDWLVTDVNDNSGIYIRMPDVGRANGNWLEVANKGWEVQIDERGFDSNTNTERNDLKLTGAIYDLAPARIRDAARPVCEWNTFEIQVRDQNVKVLLNGKLVSELANDATRPPEGFIGFQNHHPGSRVQFGNIRIKKLN
jgi:hypothetical protein